MSDSVCHVAARQAPGAPQSPLCKLDACRSARYMCCFCRHAAEEAKEQGVRARGNAWVAQIYVGKKNAYLGIFASKQEAGVVWDAASMWKSMKAPGKHVFQCKLHCMSAAGRQWHACMGAHS